MFCCLFFSSSFFVCLYIYSSGLSRFIFTLRPFSVLSFSLHTYPITLLYIIFVFSFSILTPFFFFTFLYFCVFLLLILFLLGFFFTLSYHRSVLFLPFLYSFHLSLLLSFSLISPPYLPSGFPYVEPRNLSAISSSSLHVFTLFSFFPFPSPFQSNFLFLIA